MPTPRWGLFAAVVIFATAALLSLSAASARVMTGDADTDGAVSSGGNAGDAGEVGDAWDDGTADVEAIDERDDLAGARPVEDVPPRPSPPVPTGGALLANVALTHGLLAVTVVALAWFSRIPPTALGVADVTATAVGVDVARGAAVGLALYLASEAASAVADRLGIEYDEHLRELLGPDDLSEWVLLLLVILPIIAGAEELLFRAALIGAVGAGYGVPAWVLVVGSSILFGAGHGAQGRIGVAVTAAMGLVLGVAFVATGSLVVVVVAHYVVNALEFVVREGVLG